MTPSLVKQALNTPYQEWQKIEALMEQTNNEHTLEVLRRMIYVKQKRLENERSGSQILQFTETSQ
jgi:hypothetical protein